MWPIPLVTGVAGVAGLSDLAVGFAIETRRDWDFEGRLGVGGRWGAVRRLLGATWIS